MLDHVTFSVRDYAVSRAFYEKALASLGIKLLREYGQFGGFGRTKPEFWIAQGPASYQQPEHLQTITPVHVCFATASRAEVDTFHRAALDAGGKDFGAPGLRPEYHPGYYGAFILDPDGHNVEAVCHGG
ncbi:VOC family protein [Chondromyces apiculatus]|uniref:VOC family protein n=1 Tax=Chondromyces apiculatus TaxID=51 RepID=UPI0005C5B299